MDTVLHTFELPVSRPETLELGGRYLWQTVPKTEPVPVNFIAYDPCPAFVIIRDTLGKKMRCPRDQLFYSSR